MRSFRPLPLFILMALVASGCVVPPENLRLYSLAGSPSGAEPGETSWESPDGASHIRFVWTPDPDYATTEHGCPRYRELQDGDVVGDGEYYVGGDGLTLWGRADTAEEGGVRDLGAGMYPEKWLELDGERWNFVEAEHAPDALTADWHDCDAAGR